MSKELTCDRVREILDYTPSSGNLVWKINRGNGTKKGDVAGHKNKLGYIEIRVDEILYLAHRVCFLHFYGRWPKDQIDHINHVRHDNRIENLREATNVINHRNRPKQNNNTSGVVGVSYDKEREKWAAFINVNNKKINLGRFVDKFDAICKRKSAETRYEFHQNHGA